VTYLEDVKKTALAMCEFILIKYSGVKVNCFPVLLFASNPT